MAGVDAAAGNQIPRWSQEIKNTLLSLYVHIPFCASRCGYCTFVSSVYSPENADRYLEALQAEFRARACFDSARLPETVFIGGGTPSVLSLRQLETLFSFLPRSRGECTCEMNPDSCTDKKLALLRDCGVNRLSFGVQTFDKTGLRTLQRRHTAAQAAQAVTLALKTGFDSVNIDLINGWPGQTADCVRTDLTTAAKLGVQHISNYNLILEPSAPEYAAYCALLGGEAAAEEVGARNWEIAEEVLAAHDFAHYEISNFAHPGYECAHNVQTWKGGEYLGIGLGACSHVAGVRWGNVTDFGAYCARSGEAGGAVEYSEKLDPEAKARECAVFWLRLFEGISLPEFQTRTGFDFCELYAPIFPTLIDRGVMVIENAHARVATKYWMILDAIVDELV